MASPVNILAYNYDCLKQLSFMFSYGTTSIHQNVFVFVCLFVRILRNVFFGNQKCFCFCLLDDRTNTTFGPLLHFHYTNWPDFGVAESSRLIIEMVKFIRTNIKNKNGKILFI